MIILWNKQKGTGGSGGGGSASFPTMVTDSGSSLPSASGYQEGDTFLNTSDKKIYKTEETITGYELNTGVTNANVTVNSTTGEASGFASFSSGYVTIPAKDIYRESLLDFVWYGNKTFEVVFKLDILSAGALFRLEHNYNSIYASTGIYIKSDGKIYYWMTKTQTGSLLDSIDETLLLDYVLQTDVLYKLVLKKTGNSLKIELLNKETNTTIIDNTISTVDWLANDLLTSQTGRLIYGVTDWSGSYGTYRYALTNGSIYLLDSTGEFLVPSFELSWDNGTDLTDKTEYADKTNGALYLYENSELVKIGGSLTKKVYTISADNTSTLDVSSDFTKVVDVLKNGVELAITDDYTISSGVITFVTALSTTDKITVKGE